MKKNVKVEEKKNMFSIFSSNGIVRNAKKILLAGTLICGLSLIPSEVMAKEPPKRGDNRVRVESRKPGGNKDMQVKKINNRRQPQAVHAKPAPRPQHVSHRPAPAPRPVVHHVPAPPVHHCTPRPVVHHVPAPPVHHVHHCGNDVTNAAAVVIGVASLISLLAN